jgi:hypothetical protein
MRWFLLVLMLSGCGSLLPAGRATTAAPISQECIDYDNAYIAAQAVAITGSAIGTAASTTGALIEGIVDEEDAADWALGLLITGAAGGVMAVVGNWLAGVYAERTANCEDE